MSHRRYTHAQDEEEYRELIDALNAARLQPDGTPVCTNLLTKISNSMLRTDLLNDQGDDTTLDTDLLKAVLAVMDTFAGNALIAWKGLVVLCRLQIHFAPDSDGFVEAVKGALLLHGRYNVALQDKARAMLRRWKLLCLPVADKVTLTELLSKAAQVQAQPAGASTHTAILELLHNMTKCAIFELMSVEQIEEFYTSVATFAVWCMGNYAPESPENKYVGETACRLLLQMVAGCMQNEKDSLLETGRCWLINHGVDALWKQFSLDPDMADIDFRWLAERMEKAPPLLGKHGRGEGGSA
jgi:hypothetical protein